MIGQPPGMSQILGRWPTSVDSLILLIVLKCQEKNSVKAKSSFSTELFELLVEASCYQVFELLTQVATVANQFSPYFFPEFK
jgi:hypothetical protein